MCECVCVCRCERIQQVILVESEARTLGVGCWFGGESSGLPDARDGAVCGSGLKCNHGLVGGANHGREDWLAQAVGSQEIPELEPTKISEASLIRSASNPPSLNGIPSSATAQRLRHGEHSTPGYIYAHTSNGGSGGRASSSTHTPFLLRSCSGPFSSDFSLPFPPFLEESNVAAECVHCTVVNLYPPIKMCFLYNHRSEWLVFEKNSNFFGILKAMYSAVDACLRYNANFLCFKIINGIEIQQ